MEFGSLLHQLGAEFTASPSRPKSNKLQEIEPEAKKRWPKRHAGKKAGEPAEKAAAEPKAAEGASEAAWGEAAGKRKKPASTKPSAGKEATKKAAEPAAGKSPAAKAKSPDAPPGKKTPGVLSKRKPR